VHNQKEIVSIYNFVGHTGTALPPITLNTTCGSSE